MDRRSFMRKAGATGAGVVAAAGLAAPALAQSDPKIVWRLASSFPGELDTIYGGAEDLARQLGAATNGQFTITIESAAETLPGLEVVDAVAAGTVQAAHTCSYYFWNKDPTYAIGTTIPFGLNARMQNAWYYQGNGNALMNEFYAKQGLYALPAGNTGAQMGGWFRKEVNTLDDFRGLKMRIAGLAGKVLAKIGVTAQQMPGADIYQALQSGAIDATEWVGPYDDQKLGFHKVAKYYYYPGWWEGGPVVHAMFNLQRWNDLPAHYQAALTDACAYANINMLAKYDVRNPQALKQLMADGAVLRPFSQDILDACYDAALGIYAELSASNPSFKAVYDDQLAFKRDSYLWAQIGEYAFDTFMMIQRRAEKL